MVGRAADRKRDKDIARSRTEPWRKWYALKRWRTFRADWLRRHPWCAICLSFKRSRPANVVDHVIPHRGDPLKFWGGPFQSLCAECHDNVKAAEEARGYSRVPDADGWPADPAHPFNQAGSRQARIIDASAAAEGDRDGIESKNGN